MHSCGVYEVIPSRRASFFLLRGAFLLRNAFIQGGALEPGVFLVTVGEGGVVFSATVITRQRHSVAVQLVAPHAVRARPLFLAF